MKHWKLSATIFVIFYLIFVIARLPAATALGFITLPQGVSVSGVSGTLWDGKATAVRIDRDVITHASWSLSPMPLLLGTMSADVTFGKSRQQETISGKGHISTSASLDDLVLNDFTLRVPASVLSQKARLPMPAELGGRIVLTIDSYVRSEPYCSELTGTAKWLRAEVSFANQNMALGALASKLGCDSGNAQLIVSEKNPLGLQLQATLAANAKVSAEGFIKPDGTMPTEVHNAVKFLGRPDAQGRYLIKI